MGSAPIKIMLGSDHRGRNLYNFAVRQLKNDSRYKLVLIEDYETRQIDDYPSVAAIVAENVSIGEVQFGIIIGGTGIGMCIVANKFQGVRAALCHNDVDTELSRKHNNANILCLAGDMMGESACAGIIDKWLTTEFAGGRHQTRLDKISEIEEDNQQTPSGIVEAVMC